jgi:hypothetical protein
MSEESREYFSAIVNSVGLFLLGLISSRMADKRRKKILRNLLSKEGWKWRTMKGLSNAIREDETETKRLLVAVGARASTEKKNVWTLQA